ncbi:MAG: hypothetical protein WCI78_16235 [Mycobacterium sp.]
MRLPPEVTRLARYMAEERHAVDDAAAILALRGAVVDAATLARMGPEVGRDHLEAAERIAAFYATAHKRMRP